MTSPTASPPTTMPRVSARRCRTSRHTWLTSGRDRGEYPTRTGLVRQRFCAAERDQNALSGATALLRASAEGCGERVAMVRPPAAPAVVLLHAAGPLQRGHGVRVTSVHAATGRGLDAVDRVVHGGQQLGSTVAVESVRVGDESEPGRS